MRRIKVSETLKCNNYIMYICSYFLFKKLWLMSLVDNDSLGVLGTFRRASVINLEYSNVPRNFELTKCKFVFLGLVSLV